MPESDAGLHLREKPSGYYGSDRAEVISDLAAPLGRVLDIGCGEGASAAPLRARGATWISGIEIMAEPAALAAQRLDEVLVGDAVALVADAQGPFDTILCYDVLEHLADPAALLERLTEVAMPSGRLHISIPNARHYSLVRDLVLRGTFGYSEFGHRDATHLRWFTRGDMIRMLAAHGWVVDSTTPGAIHRIRQLRLPLPSRLVNGIGGEFMTQQWYLLAHSTR